MSLIVLAAENTTLVLNGYAFSSMAEGDFVTLAPVNPHTSQTNSGNGGVNINGRVDAAVHDLTVRVQKYSADDVFLNSAINAQIPTVFNGSSKTNFVRDGSESVETYTLESGSITTQPINTKNNTDGNALMEYVLRFRSAVRAM